MDEEAAGENKPLETGRCLCCSFVCVAIKLCCFACSKALCPCCHPPPPPHKPELSVLCLGLSGSGKSTILALLAGEEVYGPPQPTMGFSIKAFISPSASFRIKELGGDERILPYWSKYFAGQDAIMFVVDSSCSTEELEKARVCLQKALKDPSLQDLPVLVLCNKRDLKSTKTNKQISEALGVSELCQGREHQVVGGSYKDIPALKRALEVLVVMTNRHMLMLRGQMGWQTIR